MAGEACSYVVATRCAKNKVETVENYCGIFFVGTIPSQKTAQRSLSALNNRPCNRYLTFSFVRVGCAKEDLDSNGLDVEINHFPFSK